MMTGKESVPCMDRRTLGEQFATATRLYAEAVVALTCNEATMSPRDYYTFREIVKQAYVRSEAIARAFDEHVESHQCVGMDSGQCTAIGACA